MRARHRHGGCCSEVLPRDATAWPAGITAALLAITIAAGTGWGVRVHARRLADHHLAAVSTHDTPFKYQTLTFQRAALASGHTLPIYGSSELYCCGSPLRPTQVFAARPTGFDVFAIGRAGTADLFFMQTFAALGRELAGRKLVVSDSPPWFFGRQGLAPAAYGHNFLPEVAFAFIFDAPITRAVREGGARRMRAYPAALDEPLLRLAVEDLADPTPVHLAEYAALVPLGRVASWILEVRDSARTAFFLWRPRWVRSEPPPGPKLESWGQLAALGTDVAEGEDTTNPFGLTDAAYRGMQRRPAFRNALALYRSGVSNRDGAIFPPPAAWQAGMTRSAAWKDLRLELRVLHELGARPLFWSLPLPGAYDDYTPRSARARATYYDRYERVVERAKVAWLDFRDQEDDPYFLADLASHLSGRGWAFADRALDVFWHGGSTDDLRAALAMLGRDVPSPTRSGTALNKGS
jgi:D-alanine transfer protein